MSTFLQKESSYVFFLTQKKNVLMTVRVLRRKITYTLSGRDKYI